MIISNVEALRTWLMGALQPICDADPSTLAKYVLALVKKDKPMSELQYLCIDQLAVFLGDETLPFVTMLFEALESESYVETVQPLMTQKSEDVIPDDDRDFRRRGKPHSGEVETAEVRQGPHQGNRPIPGRPHRSENTKRRHNVANVEIRTVDRRRGEPESNHGVSDGEQAAEQQENDQFAKPSRSLSPHRRSPSRHTSPNRRRRYKSSAKGERDHRRSRREDEHRVSRNKSGIRSREEGKHLLHELARESLNGGPNMVFNPLPGFPPSFPLPPAPMGHRPPHFPGIMPHPTSMHNSMPPPPVGNLSGGLTMVPGQHRPIPTPFEANARFPFFPMPPPQRPMHPGIMWNPPRNNFPGGVEPYNPEFPSIESAEDDEPPSWNHHLMPDQERGRDLVQLTTTSSSNPAARAAEPFRPKEDPPKSENSVEKKDTPVIEKKASVPAEVRHKPFQTQTMLELRKIPQQHNDIMSLGQYFQRFGKVLNIKVRFDNDSQAALVEFSSNAEARLAYSCPEAVLGNRFIKMFWHHSNNNKVPDATKSGAAGGTKKTFPKEMTYINPAMASNDKQQRVPDALPHNQQQEAASVEAGKRNVENKMHEIAKQKMAIQKQRQVLLEKNIQEQKRVIMLLGTKKQMSTQDKQTVLKTLKLLEAKGKKLQLDIEKSTKKVPPNPPSNEAIQKELLDGELELLSQQCSGMDTSALKLKLEDLRKRALSVGVPGLARGASRGASARGRGRGRGAWQRPKQNMSTSSLDNRSRQFFVWGFDRGDMDAVIARCAEHGNMERADEKLPGKLLVSFATRKQAEAAVKDLTSFNGKKLTLAWYEGAATKREISGEADADVVPPTKMRRRLSTSSDISMISRGGDDDKLLEFDEKDFLLLADEEEDDDDKDRPWKR